MEAVEVVNAMLKVLDGSLSTKAGFTGRIDFEVNCQNGVIKSVNAIERKVLKLQS